MKEVLNFIPVYNVNYAIILTELNIEMRKVEAMATVKYTMENGEYKMALRPMCLDYLGELELIDYDTVGFFGMAKTEAAASILTKSSLPIVIV